MQWASYSTILPTVYFPLSGAEVHHPKATSSTFYLYGGQNTSNVPQSGFFAINSALDALTAATHGETVIGALTKGYMAVMPNGNLLVTHRPMCTPATT